MSSREPEEPGDAGDRVSEDAAWADIVAHYGERPELEVELPSVIAEVETPVVAPTFGDDIDEEPWDDDDDLLLPGSFFAPEPEPLGWHGARSVAWIAVLGSPALALLWTILVQATSWSAPTWLGYLLVAAFLGGFGYLVATMPRERDDPWDDGARL